MPRFTYSDWVGRQARCLRDIRNKADTIHFKRGEVCRVVGYDKYRHFMVQKLRGPQDRLIWGLRAKDLDLIGHPDEVLRKKIMRFLCTDDVSSDGSTLTRIVDAIKEPRKKVSVQLSKLLLTGKLEWAHKLGTFAEITYSPRKALTRYDTILGLSELDL